MDELVSTIDELLESTTPRRDIGKPRLSIDRVFTMKGFGTVVTGTLIDGKLAVGQQVEILPKGQRVNIRGLQTHKQKIETALPGSRVAVNMGGIAVEELQRGMVLTTTGCLAPTRFIDVRIRAVSALEQPITHNKSITFHTGASEVTGKIRLLDKDKLIPGESGWAQLLLTTPVAVSRSDLFIIRSSTGTLGGGTIIDTKARRHRRFQQSVIDSLESREKGSSDEILLATLEANEPSEFRSLFTLCNLSPEESEKALETLTIDNRVLMFGSKGPRSLLVSIGGWNRLISETHKSIETYHVQFPLRLGMPKEELRSRLKIASQRFNDVLEKLASEGILVEEGALVKLPSHEIMLSQKQQSQVDALLASLKQNPYSPTGVELPEPELLNALAEKQLVVKMSDNVIFDASAYNEMVARVIDHLKANGKITIAEVRDMFTTSRKYALALMEHLDEQKVTRRVGDERVLR